MKSFLSLFIVVLLCVTATAQVTGVPYRAGNKFGISDAKGKMLVKPEFDFITPEEGFGKNGALFFKAYNFAGNTALSSLIFNNKIIVRDQKYKEYYLYNGLFVAIEYQLSGKKSRRSDDEFASNYALFTTDGKKIGNEDFKQINVVNELDEDNSLNQVLVVVTNQNKQHSAFLYDKKAKKITKTYFENSNYFDIDYNSEQDYRDTSVVLYGEKDGKGKKIHIKNNGKSLVVASEEDFQIKSRQAELEESRLGMYDDVAVPYAEKPIPQSADSIVLNIRKVEEKRGFYYLAKQLPEIKFVNEKLDAGNSVILINQNGKKRLKDRSKNTFIVPAAYDEILLGDFPGHHGGYVLKDGDKYGLFIYNYPEHMVINPVFDKMPLLEDFDYFGEAIPLIRLYDADGKFFCYAGKDGKLFYSPN